MTAKEYLSQIRRLTNKIIRLEREKEQLLEIASSPKTNTFERNYNASRATEASFVKYVEKADEVNRLIQSESARLNELKDSIISAVMELESSDERYLLISRYIEFASWEKIAERLNFSLSWVYKLHGRALRNFQKKIVQDS